MLTRYPPADPGAIECGSVSEQSALLPETFAMAEREHCPPRTSSLCASCGPSLLLRSFVRSSELWGSQVLNDARKATELERGSVKGHYLVCQLFSSCASSFRGKD